MPAPTPKPELPAVSRHGQWIFVLAAMIAGSAILGAFALGIWLGRATMVPPVAIAERAAPPPTSVAAAQPAPKAPLKPPDPPATTTSTPPPAIENAGRFVTLEQEDKPPTPLAAVLRMATPNLVERFHLRPEPPRAPEPFLLPRNNWFALGKVSADEPDAPEPQVCSADRTLNTALTWAKSPAEASEQALREGKLVFLIHVSGNFENPGFT